MAATDRERAMVRKIIADRWDAMIDVSGPDTVGDLIGHLIRGEIAKPLTDSAARTIEASGGSEWEPLKEEDAGPEAIWCDLRPSEAVLLIDLVSQAADVAVGKIREIIEEEITIAVRKFLAEVPEPKIVPVAA